VVELGTYTLDYPLGKVLQIVAARWLNDWSLCWWYLYLDADLVASCSSSCSRKACDPLEEDLASQTCESVALNPTCYGPNGTLGCSKLPVSLSRSYVRWIYLPTTLMLMQAQTPPLADIALNVQSQSAFWYFLWIFYSKRCWWQRLSILSLKKNLQS
jgi:hypothetical protein